MRKHFSFVPGDLGLCLFLTVTVLVSFFAPDIVSAAGTITDVGFSNDTIGGEVWNFGETLNGLSFKQELMRLVGAIYTASRSALIIMTAVAGFMVVFGQENGQKLIFSYILGVGLALNFAGFMFGLYQDYLLPTSAASMPSLPEELHKISGMDKDYLSKFMAYYIAVVTYGQTRVVPVAIRMALIFGTIQASWKLATEIGSGNQIKYVVTEVMKMSFIIFLIMNWIQLGHAMGEWFEAVGFMAGGIDPALKDSPQINPDSIWNNAMAFANKMWANVLNVSGIANTIMAFIIFIFIVIVLFLTAIEVFMCRIEFYTLSLLGIVLIPFFLIDKLNFLGTNTINSMFKISAKVMVIAFLQAVIFTILNAQLKEFYDGPLAGNFTDVSAFSAYVELAMTCLVMYVLVKEIPSLVSNFLSGGAGGIGSSSMLSTATGAAMAGTKAVGMGYASASTGLQAGKSTYAAMSSMDSSTKGGKFTNSMSSLGMGTKAIAAASAVGSVASGAATIVNTAAKATVGETVGKSKAMQHLKEAVAAGKQAGNGSWGEAVTGVYKNNDDRKKANNSTAPEGGSDNAEGDKATGRSTQIKRDE